MNNLLNDIAFCENVRKVLVENLSSPCEKIIKSQNCDYSNFQLPEPWSGDIENCCLLFISSNPAINKKEEYPDGSDYWKKEIIEDFFINRFSEEEKWTKDLRTRLKNSEFSKGMGKFWPAVRSTAKKLFGIENIKIGKDYAITEIVHCKSTNEKKGVPEALDTCAGKYLERKINLTKAPVIVVLGAIAGKYIRKKYGIGEKVLKVDLVEINKTLVFLPHPNAFEIKDPKRLLSIEQLEDIRKKLKKCLENKMKK